jgi:hypothetical protein
MAMKITAFFEDDLDGNLPDDMMQFGPGRIDYEIARPCPSQAVSAVLTSGCRNASRHCIICAGGAA